MLRKLIFVGVFTGIAAAIPVVLDRNPVVFERTAPNVAAPAETPRAELATTDAGGALHGRKVRLSADASGHFGGEFELNGRRVDAIVDTGATLIAINRSTARRLGLRLDPADFRHDVRTANGHTKAAAVVIERVEIGKVVVDQVPAMVLDDSALTHTLIGMSFLKQLNRFSVTGDSLILEQ